MSDHLILDGNQGGATFSVVEDSPCTILITGVHGDYITKLTSSEELNIYLETDVSPDKKLYSKDMKGENEFDYLLDDPIELKENERIRVDFPKTDKENTFRVFLSYDILHEGRVIHSVRKRDFRLTKKLT